MLKKVRGNSFAVSEGAPATACGAAVPEEIAVRNEFVGRKQLVSKRKRTAAKLRIYQHVS